MFVKRGGFKTVTISSVLLGFGFSMSVCLQYKYVTIVTSQQSVYVVIVRKLAWIWLYS